MTIRRSLIFLLLFLASPPVQGQMIANVFERILLVRVGGNGPGAEAGTAFTLDVDGRQYLLTAKLAANDFIEYAREGKWVRLSVQIFKCDDPTDIAVLVPPYQLTTAFEFRVDTSKISYGQDVYFLGFPYGITLNGTNVNGGGASSRPGADAAVSSHRFHAGQPRDRSSSPGLSQPSTRR